MHLSTFLRVLGCEYEYADVVCPYPIVLHSLFSPESTDVHSCLPTSHQLNSNNNQTGPCRPVGTSKKTINIILILATIFQATPETKELARVSEFSYIYGDTLALLALLAR